MVDVLSLERTSEQLTRSQAVSAGGTTVVTLCVAEQNSKVERCNPAAVAAMHSVVSSLNGAFTLADASAVSQIPKATESCGSAHRIEYIPKSRLPNLEHSSLLCQSSPASVFTLPHGSQLTFILPVFTQRRPLFAFLSLCIYIDHISQHTASFPSNDLQAPLSDSPGMAVDMTGEMTSIPF